MHSHCDNCGTDNHFISNMKSRKCTHCKSPMDWRLKVICSECGLTNRINRSETRQAWCHKCYTPISESATKEDYRPNVIPIQERLGTMFMSLLLLGLSAYVVIAQHVALSYGRRGRSALYEFNGYEISLPVACFIFALIGFLASFVDHYDKRQNEHLYRAVRRYCLGIAWVLYFVSMFFGHRVAN